LTAKNGVSSYRTRAVAYGMDKNFILNPGIDALGKIIDDFHTHSNTGAGLSLVMQSFQSHPQYAAKKRECNENLAYVRDENILKERLASLAVQTRFLQ